MFWMCEAARDEMPGRPPHGFTLQPLPRARQMGDPVRPGQLPGTATVLGWLVIAANGASWGLARLQAAAQTRAELLR